MIFIIYGNERGGVPYLQNNHTAEVLKGDPHLIQALIDTFPWQGQRFTSGVISEDDDVHSTVMTAAMEQFSFQARAGLPAESLEELFVGHCDKGRPESHFVYVDQELITGKRYSLYIDKIDRRRIQAFQELFNISYGLNDPSSRLRIRPDYTKSRLKKEHQALLMDLFEDLHLRVWAGIIENRDDVIRGIRDLGYNVRDKTYEGKTLQQPVIYLPEGRALRLKGSLLYRPDFSSKMLSSTNNDLVDTAIQINRLKTLEAIISNGLEFKAHNTIGRLFGRKVQRETEMGYAQQHLAELMKSKFQAWKVKMPVHRLFSEEGISETIYLMNQYPSPPLTDLKAEEPAPESAPPSEPFQALSVGPKDISENKHPAINESLLPEAIPIPPTKKKAKLDKPSKLASEEDNQDPFNMWTQPVSPKKKKKKDEN